MVAKTIRTITEEIEVERCPSSDFMKTAKLILGDVIDKEIPENEAEIEKLVKFLMSIEAEMSERLEKIILIDGAGGEVLIGRRAVLNKIIVVICREKNILPPMPI